MAKVEIARFLDPQEGHIAAGALAVRGFDVSFEEIGYGSIYPLMRQATEGFPLMVAEAEAGEAAAVLRDMRGEDPEALAWTRHPQALTGLPLAFTAADALTGMAVAGARARPTAFRLGFAVLMAAMVAAAFFAMWLFP